MMDVVDPTDMWNCRKCGWVWVLGFLHLLYCLFEALRVVSMSGD